MPRYLKRTSQRANRVQTAFYAGVPADAKDLAPTRRGPQPEGSVNKEIAAWRNTKPGLVLERNKRRLATPVGYHSPIMLGWLVDGSSDWVGYRSVVITPDMVGKKLAQFVAIEAKSKDGVLKDEQEKFLNALKDAGGCCGVARSFEEAEALWRK
jgi:hypothetical protein